MFVLNRPINKFRSFLVGFCFTASLAMVLSPAHAIAKLTTDEQTPAVVAHKGVAVAQIRVSRTPPPQVRTRVNPPSAAKNPMNNENLQEARNRQEAVRQERLNDLQGRGVNKVPKLRYRNTTPGGIRGIKRFTVEEVGR